MTYDTGLKSNKMTKTERKYVVSLLELINHYKTKPHFELNEVNWVEVEWKSKRDELESKKAKLEAKIIEEEGNG